MYNEMTTLRELVQEGQLSATTQQIFSNAKVNTIGQIGYGSPYYLGWLQTPGMTWAVYEEIMDLFTRMHYERSLSDPAKRDLQFANLSNHLQYELDTLFEVTFSDSDLYNHLQSQGLTVEKLHNAAIHSPYALLRLVRDFDYKQNALLRRYYRNYLCCDFYAVRNDCYAQVRDIYMQRRALFPHRWTKLFPEEIVAFFFNGKLRSMGEAQFPAFVESMQYIPQGLAFQQECISDFKQLMLLFLKPAEVYYQLAGNRYREETIHSMMSIVEEFLSHYLQKLYQWLNEDDEYDTY